MGRRELRESIFQLLFMTEFNDNQEMAEQKQLYLKESKTSRTKIRVIFRTNLKKSVKNCRRSMKH